MTEFLKAAKTKTFKREIAVLLLIVWLFMLYRMFIIITPESIDIYLPLFTTASAPIWVFISGAFVLDHQKKSK